MTRIEPDVLLPKTPEGPSPPGQTRPTPRRWPWPEEPNYPLIQEYTLKYRGLNTIWFKVYPLIKGIGFPELGEKRERNLI